MKDEHESDIILYQTDDGKAKIEVRLVNESAWLTQKMMTDLFQTTSQNITIHLKNIMKRVNYRKKQLVRISYKFKTKVTDRLKGRLSRHN
jgi:hypothetical protein